MQQHLGYAVLWAVAIAIGISLSGVLAVDNQARKDSMPNDAEPKGTVNDDLGKQSRPENALLVKTSVRIADVKSDIRPESWIWYHVVLSKRARTAVLMPFEPGLTFEDSLRFAVDVTPSVTGESLGDPISEYWVESPIRWRGQPSAIMEHTVSWMWIPEFIPLIELSSDRTSWTVKSLEIDFGELNQARQQSEIRPYPHGTSRSGLMFFGFSQQISGPISSNLTEAMFFRDISLLDGMRFLRWPLHPDKSSHKREEFSRTLLDENSITVIDDIDGIMLHRGNFHTDLREWGFYPTDEQAGSVASPR